MGLLEVFRHKRVPDGAAFDLDPGERVVAWARVDDDSVVAATPRGLWLGGGGSRYRLGWETINKVTWDSGLMTVTPAAVVEDGDVVVVEDAPAMRLRLTEPRNLPAEVRSRVTRSVRHSTHHAVAGGGVRVIGRQVPGRDGLTWAIRYDAGTPADPHAVAALVADAQRSAAAATADL